MLTTTITMGSRKTKNLKIILRYLGYYYLVV